MSNLVVRHTFNLFREDFVVEQRFHVLNGISYSPQSLVCSARVIDIPQRVHVAIKKVANAFTKEVTCIRALREIKLLRHFRGHKNIVCLFDADLVFYNDGIFNGLYLCQELMETDLSQILKSGQILTDLHYQCFIYQILCGLKYIHSAGVLHRDLKPENLLVNADCQLKICDFGISRGYSMNDDINSQFSTEYVSTRAYRAPEIMMSYQGYSPAVDIWSTGCILAEFLTGQPFFDGSDCVDHLNRILQVLGTPDDETLRRIYSKNILGYLQKLGRISPTPLSELFPNASTEYLDLLSKIFIFDKNRRITVDEALNHPYLSVWHDPEDEYSCNDKFNFEFENINNLNHLKTLLFNEVEEFRRLVREPIFDLSINNSNNSNASKGNVFTSPDEHRDSANIEPMPHGLDEPFNYSRQSIVNVTNTVETEEKSIDSFMDPYVNFTKTNIHSGDPGNSKAEISLLESPTILRRHSNESLVQVRDINSDDPLDIEKELEIGSDRRILQ
ncbi:hypothetical protein TBLA_0C03140 [Henningerozyma blattae CBS 6284]|uniref:mitogen-activated protein kinase n=1 Tax=Henningerozyma blattae (strain ATCC 34711 / CBS 6284 / DSM 70876 / NBRC 10599 / NRRL Y-10934 / UCD 77-7) TaxID=1071380 RepID=I2H166_HENB6|nr:hypothetical protein TBLA_0C03140 [Tetrapisispora blattae CBS 6284]CCH60118.1 hypothetical protein TBLA_0C03140 [Tetrapisispora blattae CBS 6284]